MEKNFILFPNYSQGLKLEALLKERHIKYVISPTPRQLSKCCGISIMYHKKDEENIQAIVRKNSIEILGFYTLDGNMRTW